MRDSTNQPKKLYYCDLRLEFELLVDFDELLEELLCVTARFLELELRDTVFFLLLAERCATLEVFRELFELTRLLLFVVGRVVCVTRFVFVRVVVLTAGLPRFT